MSGLGRHQIPRRGKQKFYGFQEALEMLAFSFVDKFMESDTFD